MITLNYQENLTFFKANIPVLVTHLNNGNHLGYDSLLTIIQDARMYWLKKYNMTEGSIDNTIGYLVKELIVDYRSEAFHGDILIVELYISELSKCSFCFEYKVSNLHSKKTVAFAKTKQVFYDYNCRKVSKTPENFITAVQFHENQSLSINE